MKDLLLSLRKKYTSLQLKLIELRNYSLLKKKSTITSFKATKKHLKKELS